MIKLTDLLKEINIQFKDPIGQGSEHTVYPSKIKPGFVMKKFTENIILKDDWVKCIQAAQQHPELFAKIDKVDFDKEYVIQEKLDEKSLTKDLNELNDYLEENPPLWDDKEIDDFEDVLDFLITYPNEINILNNTPYEKTLKPKLKDFLKRIKTAGFNTRNSKYDILTDVRIGNVGYYSTGKIKILDFQLGLP